MKNLVAITALAGSLGLMTSAASATCGTCAPRVVSAPVMVTAPCAVVSAPYVATVPCATTAICKPAPRIPNLSPPHRTSAPCGQPLFGVGNVIGEIFSPQPK